MKSRVFLFACVLAALPAAVHAADAKQQERSESCIRTGFIKETQFIDERTMLVLMTVGSSYRFEFAGICRSFGGFSNATSMGGFPTWCKTDSLNGTAMSGSGPGASNIEGNYSNTANGRESCAVDRIVPIEKAQANALLKSSRAMEDARQGKMDKAVSQFRDAIKLDPNYADAHRYLGVVLEKQGKLDDAHAEYRVACTVLVAAAKADPDDKTKADKISAIDALLSPKEGCTVK